jgi:predicted acetyltransferase
MNLHLTEPGLEHQEQYLEFLQDDDPSRLQKGKIDRVKNDWPTYLREMQGWKTGRGLPPDFVPMSIFWLTDDLRIYGESSVRHALTPNLLWAGGHIGYATRLSCRGQGYGSLLLKLTLEKCADLGLTNYVLVTCRADNHGSRRVIEKNGGQLDIFLPTVWEQDQSKLRYWIKIG